MAQANTATIKIEKDNSSHRGVVRGAVNGQPFEFPVNKEIEVTEAQLNALRDSRVEFTTVTPLAGEDADEGSSASSTIMGTAIRAEPPAGAVNPALEAGDKELDQRSDSEITEAQRAAEEAAKEEAAAGGGQAGDAGAGAGDEAKESTVTKTATRAQVAKPTTKPKKAAGGTKPKTTATKAAANK